MPTTEVKDTIGITKNAVYSIWEKNLTFADISNTLPEIKPSNYNISFTPTSVSIDQDKIHKTAEIWEVLNRNTTILISSTSLSTIQQCKSAVPSLLSLLDKETFDFCNQKNILFDATIYYKLIYENFHNIKDIKIILQSDYEIKNLKMVRFDVKIHDGIDTILQEEDEFIGKICELISKESRLYFVLTTQVV